MSKSIKSILTVIITLIVAIIFIIYIDWIKLGNIVKKFSIGDLILLAFLYFMTYLVRSIRFKAILMQDSLSLINLLQITMKHGFYNRILPARSGELSYVYLITRNNQVSVEKALSSLVIVRIYDILTALIIFNFVVLTFYKHLVNQALLLLSIFALIILLLILVYLNRIISLSSKIALKFIEPKKESVETLYRMTLKISSFLRNASDYVSILQKSRSVLFVILLTSFLIWIIIFIYFYIFLINIGMDISFYQTIFGSTFSNLTNVLPISAIGGFGTMETGWVLGFRLIGVETSEALSVGVSVNLLTFVLISGFMGLSILIDYLLNSKKDIR